MAVVNLTWIILVMCDPLKVCFPMEYWTPIRPLLLEGGIRQQFNADTDKVCPGNIVRKTLRNAGREMEPCCTLCLGPSSREENEGGIVDGPDKKGFFKLITPFSRT